MHSLAKPLEFARSVIQFALGFWSTYVNSYHIATCSHQWSLPRPTMAQVRCCPIETHRIGPWTCPLVVCSTQHLQPRSATTDWSCDVRNAERERLRVCESGSWHPSYATQPSSYMT